MKYLSKHSIVFRCDENSIGEGRKCWLTAISPFPMMFSKVVSSVASKVIILL